MPQGLRAPCSSGPAHTLLLLWGCWHEGAHTALPFTMVVACTDPIDGWLAEPSWCLDFKPLSGAASYLLCALRSCVEASTESGALVCWALHKAPVKARPGHALHLYRPGDGGRTSLILPRPWLQQGDGVGVLCQTPAPHCSDAKPLSEGCGHTLDSLGGQVQAGWIGALLPPALALLFLAGLLCMLASVGAGASETLAEPPVLSDSPQTRGVPVTRADSLHGTKWSWSPEVPQWIHVGSRRDRDCFKRSLLL